jgi:hypothetical protein
MASYLFSLGEREREKKGKKKERGKKGKRGNEVGLYSAFITDG